MAKRKTGIEVTDLDTGEFHFIPSDTPTHLIEVLNGYADQIHREKNGNSKEPTKAFVKLMQSETVDEKIDKLSPRASQVFLKMMMKVTYGGRIETSQKEISDAIKTDKADVSRAVKELVKAELIYEGEKVSGRPSYFVSKQAAQKGRTKLSVVANNRTPEQGKAPYVKPKLQSIK